ncbi:DUF6585 family protein [Kitasatospora sp. NPDC048545]|uniref:DUF6585 family protein n=1 Tax=Kitasatospora sp. NPDC048545 TaxID=3157208 RepID=UPI00340B8196
MDHTTGPDDGPLPNQVVEAAAQRQLGSHRATYVPIPPSPAAHRSDRIVLSVSFALLVSAGIALAPTSPALGVFCIAPITVLVVSRVVRENRIRRTRKDAGLHLYEHGLVVAAGGRLRALRWDAMTVHQNIGRYHTFGRSTRIKHAYTLRDGDGREVTVREGFPNAEEWGPRIQQAVADAQLTDAITALRAGKTLPFGCFRLSRNGIDAGGRRVTWSQVKGVGTRQGLVSVEVAGRRAGLSGDPVRMFPNLRLFTSLVEQLRS